MLFVTTYIECLVHRLKNEEEGLALTEYLVLLGLLIGGVILAVTAFGRGLGNTWNGWATWFQTAPVTAP